MISRIFQFFMDFLCSFMFFFASFLLFFSYFLAVNLFCIFSFFLVFLLAVNFFCCSWFFLFWYWQSNLFLLFLSYNWTSYRSYKILTRQTFHRSIWYWFFSFFFGYWQSTRQAFHRSYKIPTWSQSQGSTSASS